MREMSYLAKRSTRSRLSSGDHLGRTPFERLGELICDMTGRGGIDQKKNECKWNLTIDAMQYIQRKLSQRTQHPNSRYDKYITRLWRRSNYLGLLDNSSKRDNIIWTHMIYQQQLNAKYNGVVMAGSLQQFDNISLELVTNCTRVKYDVKGVLP